MSNQIEQQRAKAEGFCKALHRGISTLDVSGGWYDELMTADSELQYANNPVVKGEDARNIFGQLFQELDLCDHTLRYVDYVPPRVYQAVTVVYRVKGYPPSEDIKVQGLVTFYVNEDGDGNLKAYRSESFVDSSELFARLAEKKTKSSS